MYNACNRKNGSGGNTWGLKRGYLGGAEEGKGGGESDAILFQ